MKVQIKKAILTPTEAYSETSPFLIPTKNHNEYVPHIKHQDGLIPITLKSPIHQSNRYSNNSIRIFTEQPALIPTLSSLKVRKLEPALK